MGVITAPIILARKVSLATERLKKNVNGKFFYIINTRIITFNFYELQREGGGLRAREEK